LKDQLRDPLLRSKVELPGLLPGRAENLC
jgi:hypothetical protein